MSKEQDNALAQVRRLAAFGLSSRLAFPEFVRLLSEVVPFDTASMLWLGADYQPIDSFVSVPNNPDIAARYASRWFNAEEGDYYPAQLAMQSSAAFGVIRVSDFTPAFSETEIYDEVFKAVEHHWIAGLALHDGTRPIGNLGIGRPPGMADFSDDEVRLLKLVRPYIVQALSRDTAPGVWPEADAEDKTAVVIANLQGGIVHASPGAWNLLQGAAGLPADTTLLRDQTNAWAEPLLMQLGQRVIRALEGSGAPPARMDRITAYGRFVIRAYALDGNGPADVQAICIQIERRLPLSLMMMRSPAFRALTPREQDVAQMLGEKLSYNEIAERMNVGWNTVVSHVRNLGAKLDAAGRDEIVSTLSR